MPRIIISHSRLLFCLGFPTTSVDACSKCGKEQNGEIYDFECCFLLNWRSAQCDNFPEGKKPVGNFNKLPKLFVSKTDFSQKIYFFIQRNVKVSQPKDGNSGMKKLPTYKWCHMVIKAPHEAKKASLPRKSLRDFVQKKR